MKKLMNLLMIFFILPSALLPQKFYHVKAESSSASQTEDVSHENYQLNHINKMYGIGSVSKVFTAAAIMKLEETGKIKLDEPIVTYMPDFYMADERYKKITPRMLLNHSSGLMGTTDTNPMIATNTNNYYHDHFLELLAEQTLKHEPGDRSIYSNDSYTLAEHLIEQVSGMSYTEYLENTFFIPMNLNDVKSSESNFDQTQLVDIYLGSRPLKPEYIPSIGSGGLYSSMTDLCYFSTIFMNQSDGSVLSKESADEMAKNQHQMALSSPNADSIFHYGLGWDSVNTYPFNQYNIQAVSKGGSTYSYKANLTVLPEYNMTASVAVSTTGSDDYPQLIAQEILLEVLREEGLIPDEEIQIPTHNMESANIPEELKSYAGLYNSGFLGANLTVEFTEDRLILTPIGVRNERAQQYIYNTDGVFASLDDNFFGKTIISDDEDAFGICELYFTDGKYLAVQTYVEVPGLGITAVTTPLAEKIEPNEVADYAIDAWESRNNTTYLLSSEKHSIRYILYPYTKILTDSRILGYVNNGIRLAGEASGMPIKSAKIIDADTALGFQAIPTLAGRDINNLSVSYQNGIEYLTVNGTRYMDSRAAKPFSSLEDIAIVDSETLWTYVDEDATGQKVSIHAPEDGDWYIYDENMNCIASSQEKNPRETIILPENGRVAFAGKAGAEFVIK